MNNFKTSTIALFCLIPTLLPGCGTMTAQIIGMHKQYADTTQGKKAKLRVKYEILDQIHIFPNSTCLGENSDPDAGRAISKPIAKKGLHLVVIDNITFEEKLLGIPHPPFELKPDLSRVYSEFYIPAEKNFLIRMSYMSSYGAPGSAAGYKSFFCPTKHFTMNAQEGHNYELELIKTRGLCIYSMNEIGEDGTRIPVETWKAIADENCSRQSLVP